MFPARRPRFGRSALRESSCANLMKNDVFGCVHSGLVGSLCWEDTTDDRVAHFSSFRNCAAELRAHRRALKDAVSRYAVIRCRTETILAGWHPSYKIACCRGPARVVASSFLNSFDESSCSESSRRFDRLMTASVLDMSFRSCFAGIMSPCWMLLELLQWLRLHC
jgi:hypothetical protein